MLRFYTRMNTLGLAMHSAKNNSQDNQSQNYQQRQNNEHPAPDFHTVHHAAFGLDLTGNLFWRRSWCQIGWPLSQSLAEEFPTVFALLSQRSAVSGGTRYCPAVVRFEEFAYSFSSKA